MNPMLRTLVAGSLVASGTLLFAGGCVDNDSTLFIKGVMYRKAPGCVVNADPNGVFIGAGTLDVAFSRSYTAALLVGNQYTPRGDKDKLRAETTRVSLRGAEVSLTNSEGDTLQTFSVYGSGFANSNRGADPGWGIFDAQLIPGSVGETLAGQVGASAVTTVYASIRVFGDTLGGQEIESAELTFPIEVCNGCLVQYPLAALDFTNPAFPRGQCISNSGDVPASGCHPGQDDYLDCRACAGTMAICQQPPAL